MLREGSSEKAIASAGLPLASSTNHHLRGEVTRAVVRGPAARVEASHSVKRNLLVKPKVYCSKTGFGERTPELMMTCLHAHTSLDVGKGAISRCNARDSSAEIYGLEIFRDQHGGDGGQHLVWKVRRQGDKGKDTYIG